MTHTIKELFFFFKPTRFGDFDKSAEKTPALWKEYLRHPMRSICLHKDFKGDFVILYKSPLWISYVLENVQEIGGKTSKTDCTERSALIQMSNVVHYDSANISVTEMQHLHSRT